jgi:hypothetical protein
MTAQPRRVDRRHGRHVVRAAGLGNVNADEENDERNEEQDPEKRRGNFAQRFYQGLTISD